MNNTIAIKPCCIEFKLEELVQSTRRGYCVIA